MRSWPRPPPPPPSPTPRSPTRSATASACGTCSWARCYARRSRPSTRRCTMSGSSGSSESRRTARCSPRRSPRPIALCATRATTPRPAPPRGSSWRRRPRTRGRARPHRLSPDIAPARHRPSPHHGISPHPDTSPHPRSRAALDLAHQQSMYERTIGEQCARVVRGAIAALEDEGRRLFGACEALEHELHAGERTMLEIAHSHRRARAAHGVGRGGGEPRGLARTPERQGQQCAPVAPGSLPLEMPSTTPPMPAARQPEGEEEEETGAMAGAPSWLDDAELALQRSTSISR